MSDTCEVRCVREKTCIYKKIIKTTNTVGEEMTEGDDIRYKVCLFHPLFFAFKNICGKELSLYCPAGAFVCERKVLSVEK